jgi:D-3-phosphoglycerate dehydrogenase
MVSAPLIARERGIKISEIRKDYYGAFESYIRVKVVTEKQVRSIAGTIYSDGKPRFIQIKGINLEAEPQKFMLYTMNADVPGYIGALGTALGDLKVNIATFALGRSQNDGQAIALLGVDDIITAEILKRVRELPQVRDAYSLTF